MADEKLLIITPTYNERDNLRDFVDSVLSVVPHANILIVDDNSPDKTGELADELAAADERLFVMHRKGKLGLGTAYVAGFRWGLERDYDLFFEMDADHSHDPRYLPEFLEAFAQGADLVVGSRNIPGGGVEGWGLGRHLLSKGGSLYSRFCLGVDVRDLTSGYKGFRRNVLETISLEAVRSEGYSFQVELTYRTLLAGFNIHEVPIIFVDRQAGQSKMSKRIFVEAIRMMPKLRLDAIRGKLK